MRIRRAVYRNDIECKMMIGMVSVNCLFLFVFFLCKECLITRVTYTSVELNIPSLEHFDMRYHSLTNEQNPSNYEFKGSAVQPTNQHCPAD